MPRRIDLNEGEAVEINGIALAVAAARGKRAILVVGGYDGDGLLETEDDCRRYAARLLAKVDSGERIGKDGG